MAPPKKDRRLERIAAIAKLRFGPRWAAPMCKSADVRKSLLSMVINGERGLTDEAYRKLVDAIDREISEMDKASAKAKRIRALMN